MKQINKIYQLILCNERLLRKNDDSWYNILPFYEIDEPLSYLKTNRIIKPNQWPIGK